MKTQNILLVFTIMLLISCEENEITYIPVDTESIYHQIIDHQLIEHGCDTLEQFSLLYFTMDSIDNSCYLNMITGYIGVGMNVSADITNELIFYEFGDIISANTPWSNITESEFDTMHKPFDLNKITGIGDCYIGLRHSGPCGPELTVSYGWLCVNYSANGDTLRVIDKARNSQNGAPIFAGQIE